MVDVVRVGVRASCCTKWVGITWDGELGDLFANLSESGLEGAHNSEARLMGTSVRETGVPARLVVLSHVSEKSSAPVMKLVPDASMGSEVPTAKGEG